jgi:hypothetical protein
VALGSKKDKALTKAEIINEAQKLDNRRQEQIARQSEIISRLVTENQMMMGLLGELKMHEGNLVGFRDKAGEILDNIEKMREESRKKEQKND